MSQTKFCTDPDCGSTEVQLLDRSGNSSAFAPEFLCGACGYSWVEEPQFRLDSGELPRIDRTSLGEAVDYVATHFSLVSDHTWSWLNSSETRGLQADELQDLMLCLEQEPVFFGGQFVSGAISIEPSLQLTEAAFRVVVRHPGSGLLLSSARLEARTILTPSRPEDTVRERVVTALLSMWAHAERMIADANQRLGLPTSIGMSAR